MTNSADADHLDSEEVNCSAKAGHIQVQQDQGWFFVFFHLF